MLWGSASLWIIGSLTSGQVKVSQTLLLVSDMKKLPSLTTCEQAEQAKSPTWSENRNRISKSCRLKERAAEQSRRQFHSCLSGKEIWLAANSRPKQTRITFLLFWKGNLMNSRTQQKRISFPFISTGNLINSPHKAEEYYIPLCLEWTSDERPSKQKRTSFLFV